MNLTLYSHPLSSYCWKVLIALHENGTPFDTRMVNLGDPEAKAAFKTLWPTAKIPLLEDGSEIVPETSIMIEYIEQRYPGKVRLIPQDPHKQLSVRLWDRLFDLYVMTPMQRFIAQQLRPRRSGTRESSRKSVQDEIAVCRKWLRTVQISYWHGREKLRIMAST
jgi:glutathione S-transferase